MYEKHFGFKFKPFKLVPNPDFLFLSKTHKKAITYLDYGIKEKVGFVLLTGDIGAGKTTIIRNLIKNLSESVDLAKINNTKVSSEQLISMINEDFGLDVEGKNKTRLLSDLNHFLIEQYANNIQPVLLIDEAQNLSASLLEEVRLLSNLETDSGKLLQIILVGQPELKKTLMRPDLTQLRQRININCHISPLSIDETAKYIKHRLTIAGNPDAINFHDDMLYLIYQFSRGIPRLINIVCDFALLSAFVDSKKEVTSDIVSDVINDLDSREYWSDEGSAGPAAANSNGSTVVNEDMNLRLVKLEKLIENSLKEIVSLEKKINIVHGDVSNVINSHEIIKLNKLLGHLMESENALPDQAPDVDKPYEQRVDHLNKMLSEINAKLKKTKFSI